MHWMGPGATKRPRGPLHPFHPRYRRRRMTSETQPSRPAAAPTTKPIPTPQSTVSRNGSRKIPTISPTNNPIVPPPQTGERLSRSVVAFSPEPDPHGWDIALGGLLTQRGGTLLQLAGRLPQASMGLVARQDVIASAMTSPNTGVP